VNISALDNFLEYAKPFFMGLLAPEDLRRIAATAVHKCAVERQRWNGELLILLRLEIWRRGFILTLKAADMVLGSRGVVETLEL
jgi:hypothetical protein